MPFWRTPPKSKGEGRTEDDLAMLRSEREFTNLLLCELPNGDFAQTITRQFLFDAYQLGLWELLSTHPDATLAGVAAKAIDGGPLPLPFLVVVGGPARRRHR